MEYISLNSKFNTIHRMSISFLLKLTHLREVWLFNCFEGCQHAIFKQGIKINQISKIIISELNIETISGLLGVLSSLSLSNRKNPLHIYGPQGLEEYIYLGKKYSHTNFCYRIYLYSLSSGFIIDHYNYQIYLMAKSHCFEISAWTRIKPGKFNITKAKMFYVISGPLYGRLKNNLCFILPDGSIVDGIFFIDNSYIGIKINLFNNIYHTRQHIENSMNANVLFESLYYL